MEKGKKSVKKSTKKNRDNIIKGVFSEMKKVKWPEAKNIVKYSLATFIFCLILVAYFQGLDFVSSLIRGLFN